MRYLLAFLLFFSILSFAEPDTEQPLEIKAQLELESFVNLSATPMRWESLMPADYIPEPQLFIFEVGPDEALMQQAIAEAPLVYAFDDVAMTVPGYVVPLEGDENVITEFLLVPYFGACIHIPPPPVNQTIYVKPRYPLLVDESWDIITVAGTLQAESATSDFGAAGYSFYDALIIPFDPEEYDSLEVVRPDETSAEMRIDTTSEVAGESSS